MHNNPDKSYLGIGMYPISEAAKILRLPVGKLHRWTKGYYFSARDTRRVESRALLQQHDYPELAAQGIVTFLEMIELYLISIFRERGVSMQTIRKVAKRIAERFRTNHPFALMGLRTDGKHIIGEMEDAESGASRRFLEELHNCQIVFDIAEQFLYPNADAHDDLIHRYWPIGKEKGVVCDPQRNFGQPILDRYRVPTYPLYNMFRSGESPETIAWWYEIDVGSVQSAIEFECFMAA